MTAIQEKTRTRECPPELRRAPPDLNPQQALTLSFEMMSCSCEHYRHEADPWCQIVCAFCRLSYARRVANARRAVGQ